MSQGPARLLSISLFLALFAPLISAATSKPPPQSTGALAYHRDSGSFGFSINAATARIAKTDALALCGHPKCEVVANLRNSCGVIANGPKRFYVTRGATRQEAEAKVMRLCGERCEIVGWACTR